MSDEDIDAIVAFLGTLTDAAFLAGSGDRLADLPKN